MYMNLKPNKYKRISFNTTTMTSLGFLNFYADKLFCLLTHLLQMHAFSTPCTHQKTLRISDVFTGPEKGCIKNEWVK